MSAASSAKAAEFSSVALDDASLPGEFFPRSGRFFKISATPYWPCTKNDLASGAENVPGRKIPGSSAAPKGSTEPVAELQKSGAECIRGLPVLRQQNAAACGVNADTDKRQGLS